MMVFRRFIAIPFFFVFVSFLSGLLFFATIYRMKNPEIYTTQLQKAKVYELMADKLPNLLAKDLQQKQNINIGPVVEHLLRETFPASWIQETLEQEIMKPFWPYLYGKEDQFTISLSLAGRVTALLNSLKAKVLHSEKSKELYTQFTLMVAKDQLSQAPENRKEMLQLLFPGKDLEQTISTFIQTLYPLEEVRKTLASNLDILIAFAKKQDDRCLLSFDFSNSMIRLLDSLQEKLADKATVEGFVRTLVIPALQNQQFPFDIAVQPQDASMIVDKLSLSWMANENKNIFGPINDYLSGKNDGFSIDLNNYKLRVSRVFAALMESKLREKWNSLLEGRPEDREKILEVLYRGEMPSERPYGMSFEQMVQETGIDIPQIVDDSIQMETGVQLTFSEEDLQRSVPANLRENVYWENNQPWKVLKVDVGNSINNEQLAAIFEKAEVVFTEKNVANPEGLNEFRTFFRSLPIVLLILFIFGYIPLFIAARLSAKETSHTLLWSLILIGAGALIIVFMTDAFDREGWPIIMKEMEKNMQRGNPENQVIEEITVQMVVALKNAFVGSVKFLAIFAAILSALAVITTPIFKALLANNNQRTFHDDRDGLASPPQ